MGSCSSRATRYTALDMWRSHHRHPSQRRSKPCPNPSQPVLQCQGRAYSWKEEGQGLGVHSTRFQLHNQHSKRVQLQRFRCCFACRCWRQIECYALEGCFIMANPCHTICCAFCFPFMMPLFPLFSTPYYLDSLYPVWTTLWTCFIFAKYITIPLYTLPL